MARRAKRSKSTNTAGSMANMRDAVTVRNMRFVDINKQLNVEVGPGNPETPFVTHRIVIDASEHLILADYMTAMVSVLYLDLIAPGFQTPSKLADWKEIAREVSVNNKTNVSIRDTFNSIARKISECTKRMTSMIHFESKSAELKFLLYDLMLKISMEHRVDLKGMLPSM